MIWDLQGTPAQNAIVEQALAKCDYPFERLLPKLQAEQRKITIPVEWADLSTYGAGAASAAGAHEHIHEDGDTGHPITHPEHRSRVLGLAWYSGRVSLDLTLESDPLLAMEVFLAEGAHQVDFWAMSDEQREYLFLAMHNFDGTEHGHSWFDVGEYGEWLGESFMEAFIRAFAPSIPVTVILEHPGIQAQARYIRAALLGPKVYTAKSGVYHDSHKRTVPNEWLISAAEAQRQSFRACGTCKPA